MVVAGEAIVGVRERRLAPRRVATDRILDEPDQAGRFGGGTGSVVARGSDERDRGAQGKERGQPHGPLYIPSASTDPPRE